MALKDLAIETKKTPLTEAQLMEKALNDMALNIQKISDMFAAIDRSKISKKLLNLMIKDMTGLHYTQINQVLEALPNLKKQYLK
jgi:hypothetical protein